MRRPQAGAGATPAQRQLWTASAQQWVTSEPLSQGTVSLPVCFMAPLSISAVLPSGWLGGGTDLLRFRKRGAVSGTTADLFTGVFALHDLHDLQATGRSGLVLQLSLQLGTGCRGSLGPGCSPKRACGSLCATRTAQGTLLFAALCPGASRKAVPCLAERPRMASHERLRSCARQRGCISIHCCADTSARALCGLTISAGRPGFPCGTGSF